MQGSGFPEHIRFRNAEVCRACQTRVCVEMCLGQAITPHGDGLPGFDRKKCVHCCACLWNCPEIDEDGQASLIAKAGTDSAEQ